MNFIYKCNNSWFCYLLLCICLLLNSFISLSLSTASVPTSTITMAVWADNHGNKGVTQIIHSITQRALYEVDSWLWDLRFSQQCYWMFMCSGIFMLTVETAHPRNTYMSVPITSSCCWQAATSLYSLINNLQISITDNVETSCFSLS